MCTFVIECLESVFTGNSEALRKDIVSTVKGTNAEDISFEELTLFCTRGLSHTSKRNPFNARLVIKTALSALFESCMDVWAGVVVAIHGEVLRSTIINDLSINSVEANCANSDDVYEPDKVSSCVMRFFLGISSDLMRSMCPADLQSGISLSLSTNIVISMQRQLLQKSCVTFFNIIESDALSSLLRNDLKSEIALIQLWYDVKFTLECYARAKAGLTGDEIKCLEKQVVAIESLIDPMSMEIVSSSINGTSITSSHSVSCSIFTEALFHTELNHSSIETSSLDVGSKGRESFVSTSLIPVPSTRRFLLLPIQDERQDLLLELRRTDTEDINNGQKGMSKGDVNNNPLSKSSFGFLSSMLGK